MLPEGYLNLIRSVDPKQLQTLMALIKGNQTPKNKFENKPVGYRGLPMNPPISNMGRSY